MNGRHGTQSRSGAKRAAPCPCDECSSMRRAMSTGVDHATGRLLVQCWCRSDLVLVAPSVVSKGRTRSCGRPRCASKENR